MIPAGQTFQLQKSLHTAGLRHPLLRGVLLARRKLCLDEVIPECFPNLTSRGMLWLHPSSRLGTCSNPRASERGNPDGNAAALSPAGAGDHDTRSGEHRQSSGTCLPMQSFTLSWLPAPPAVTSPHSSEPCKVPKKHPTRQHLQIPTQLIYRAVKPIPVALILHRGDLSLIFSLRCHANVSQGSCRNLHG